MRYWIYWNDLIQGPFEIKELQSLSAFTAELPVCEEDRQDWAPAAAISELLPYFQQTPTFHGGLPSAPPPPPPRPPSMSPLQGEFLNESPGQEQLFDMNGTKQFYYRPAEDAAGAPTIDPPPLTTPFHFMMFSPPAPHPVEEIRRPPVVKSPEHRYPEPEETGESSREPEEIHRVESPTVEKVIDLPPAPETSSVPQFVPPPLEEHPEPVVVIPEPPKEEMPASVAIPDFNSSRAPVVEAETFSPVIEETPELETKTRLWPWVLGICAAATLGALVFRMRGRQSAPVMTPAPIAVPAPMVTPRPPEVSQPTAHTVTRHSSKTSRNSMWQTIAESESGIASPVPTAVAFDAQGQMWVTDQANHHLHMTRVSAVGSSAQAAVQIASWQAFGESGTADGQFNGPAGVATDSQGNVWVADQGNNRMQVYDPAARKWSSVGRHGSEAGEFNSPSGTAASSQGQIWVADKNNNRLQMRDPDTRQWTVVGQEGSQAGQFKTPSGVAVDSQGRVWVADQGNDRVQVFNPVTKQWRVIGEPGTDLGQFNSPSGVAVDTKGRVWVTEQGNHRVQVFNPTTKRWTVLGKKGGKTGEFNTPSGIAFDQQGRVWVADQGNRRLQVAQVMKAAPLAGGKKIGAKAVPAPEISVPVEHPAPTPAIPENLVNPAPAVQPAIPAAAPTVVPGMTTTPAPTPPVSQKADKWRAREQEAIDIVLKKKIYKGKRTIQENAKTMLDSMHDKELLQAAETGDRLYLPDKLSWSGLHEEGPRYRVYLNFLAMQANGDRVLARSDQFSVDLRTKSVTPLDDSTRHDFYDIAAMQTHQHSAKAGEIQIVLDGVDLVNKNKLHVMIMKSSKQKDQLKKLQADLTAASDKLNKEFAYFRTKFAEKTLQNVAKAYDFTAILKGN